MTKILQIALNTFRESVRDKVLYVIAFFAVLMMLASQGLGWISVGDQVQIVKHFSLGVVSLFGTLIAVFVGTGLIFKEIDKRTIYTILSKPVYRFQFVLGKFLGLLGVMLCIVIGMGLVASGFVIYVGGEVDAIYCQALAFVFLEMGVITALAILFSTAASPILSAIFTFMTYLVGQLTETLLQLADPLKYDLTKAASSSGAKLNALTKVVSDTHWLLKPFSEFMYWILPNLSHFQLRNRVVNGPPLADGEALSACVYAACYITAVLLLAIIFFDRKRF